MSQILHLALGRKGGRLTVPETVAIDPVVAEPADAPAPPAAELVRHALAAPLAGPALREIATGHRRAAVLLGDVSYPAPYPETLPELTRALVEAGIRPSRIAFLCCPGLSGPVLGRNAIRRYGEEVVGEHELRAWRGDYKGACPDPLYDGADLRVAVLPARFDAAAALPGAVQPDFALALVPGRGSAVTLAGVRAGAFGAVFPATPGARTSRIHGAQVLLATGGGAPTDATLEDALAGLRWRSAQTAAQATLILAFDGWEGLGSARFTLDLREIFQGYEDESLPRGADGDPWFPAAGLADALLDGQRLVLFSQPFSQHEDGLRLQEELSECPRLAERLVMVSTETELWSRLEAWHSKDYRLAVEPLGWRGTTSDL